jgi:hypothetical protein
LEKMGSLLRHRGIALSVSGLAFVLSTKTAAAAPIGLANGISHLAVAQALKSWTGFTLLKEACFTRLNAGIVSTAMVIGLAILLIPTGQSEAMVEAASPQKQEVAQVDQAVAAESFEASDEAPEPVPVQVIATTKPPPAPPAAGPAPVAKPVPVFAVQLPLAVPPSPKPAPPPAVASVPAPMPTPNRPGQAGGNAQAQARGEWNAGGNSSVSTPPRSRPLAPRANLPPTPVARNSTNSTTKVVVQPVVNRSSAPWASASVQNTTVAPMGDLRVNRPVSYERPVITSTRPNNRNSVRSQR